MKTRVWTLLGALLLVAAAPLTAAVPAVGASAAVPVPAVVAAPLRELVLHTNTAEVGPTINPVVLTSGCGRDEQLVSGGYGPIPTIAGIYLADSFPSDNTGAPPADGNHPTAWSIGVVNETKNAVRIQYTAACVTGNDARSIVSTATETHSENTFSLTTICPADTVRVGGGYRSDWNRRLGRGAVTGNYPRPDQAWGVDVALLPSDPDIKARATLTAFAVCLAGPVDGVGLSPTTLTLTNGKQVCTGGDQVFAATCGTPQSGSQRVDCATGQILTGGGYRVIAGSLPGNYPVNADTAVTGPAWTIAVNGTNLTATTTQLQITPLCVLAAVTDSPDAGTTGGAAVDSSSTVDLVAAAAGGGLLLVVLLVLFLIVRAVRRSARRRRGIGRGPGPRQPTRHPITGTGLEIVVRAQRSNYRLDRFRETR